MVQSRSDSYELWPAATHTAHKKNKVWLKLQLNLDLIQIPCGMQKSFDRVMPDVIAHKGVSF